jgi:hypothetical protein
MLRNWQRAKQEREVTGGYPPALNQAIYIP